MSLVFRNIIFEGNDKSMENQKDSHNYSIILDSWKSFALIEFAWISKGVYNSILRKNEDDQVIVIFSP